MYVITANVRYYLNGPLVPSFISSSQNKFAWDDESAEFFGSYQDAWAFADDFVDGRISVDNSNFGVEDIEIKGIELKETVSTKRNKDYGEMEMLMKSNN